MRLIRLSLLLAAASLAACGQTGPLYLPKSKPPPHPSGVPSPATATLPAAATASPPMTATGVAGW